MAALPLYDLDTERWIGETATAQRARIHQTARRRRLPGEPAAHLVGITCKFDWSDPLPY